MSIGRRAAKAEAAVRASCCGVVVVRVRTVVDRSFFVSAVCVERQNPLVQVLCARRVSIVIYREPGQVLFTVGNLLDLECAAHLITFAFSC